jgi:hypothetical protein
MADRRADPDTGDDSGVGPYREPPAGTPRWVKVFGLVALVVVVLFVVVLLIGGGEHGPSRHSPGGGSDAPGNHAWAPPGVTHTQR